jgi:hypothetical protein
MIVQATNTGGDLGSNQFDLAIPGGGVGIFNACTDEFNAPSSGWGAQYGGISSNTCSTFPKALQAGCGFRWDWFEGADNPEVEFERVECPAEIVAKSGCKRDDDGAQVKAAVAASKAPVASSSPVAAASSSSSAAVQSVAEASSSVEAVAVASSASLSSAPSLLQLSLHPPLTTPLLPSNHLQPTHPQPLPSNFLLPPPLPLRSPALPHH